MCFYKRSLQKKKVLNRQRVIIDLICDETIIYRWNEFDVRKIVKRLIK